MIDQQLTVWAQLFGTSITFVIAVLTLFQSCINKRALEEMQISRIESVCPHLTPSLESVEKGFADGETSYIFDMKVVFDLNQDFKCKVNMAFDIAFLNLGKGPAYNLEVIKMNDISVQSVEKSIRIINPGDQKQIQFEIFITNQATLKADSEIYINYEDSFGNLYEQVIVVEIEQVFYRIKNVFPMRPKLVKK